MNHVVRIIQRKSGIITTIAGNYMSVKGQSNSIDGKDPLRPNSPEISSMEYCRGILYIPTDLSPETGDLLVLRKARD